MEHRYRAWHLYVAKAREQEGESLGERKEKKEKKRTRFHFKIEEVGLIAGLHAVQS